MYGYQSTIMKPSLASKGTPGKPQPIVQAAVGSVFKPPGIVMPQAACETRNKSLAT